MIGVDVLAGCAVGQAVLDTVWSAVQRGSVQGESILAGCAGDFADFKTAVRAAEWALSSTICWRALVAVVQFEVIKAPLAGLVEAKR